MLDPMLWKAIKWWIRGAVVIFIVSNLIGVWLMLNTVWETRQQSKENENLIRQVSSNIKRIEDEDVVANERTADAVETVILEIECRVYRAEKGYPPIFRGGKCLPP